MKRQNSSYLKSKEDSVSTSNKSISLKLHQKNANLRQSTNLSTTSSKKAVKTPNLSSKQEIDAIWDNFSKQNCFTEMKDITLIEGFERFLNLIKRFQLKFVKLNHIFSDSSDGTNLLKESKFWIIFIHSNLFNKRFSYEEIVECFSHAVNDHNVVQQLLLFEYFLLIVDNFSPTDILNLDFRKLPKAFVHLYASEKENIFRKVNFSLINQDSIFYIPVKPNSPPKKISPTLRHLENYTSKEEEFSFSHENSRKGKELEKPKNEGSHRKKTKPQTTIKIDSPQFEGLDRFIWNDKVSFQESNKKFLINKLPNFTSEKKKNSLESLERFDFENESMLNEKIDFNCISRTEEAQEEKSYSLLEKYLSPSNHHNGTIPEIHNEELSFEKEKGFKEFTLDFGDNQPDEILGYNESQNQSSQQLYKRLLPEISFQFRFEMEESHDSFYILENNLDDCGNFAILELCESSRKKYGDPFIVTPLKKYSTKEERKKAEIDLKKISEQYGTNFTFKPYNEGLASMLRKLHKEASKEPERRSFKEFN